MNALALPRPWLDKKGRLSWLRTVTFVLLWVPAVWYAARYALNDLGARPTHAVLLGAGLWAIWWLMIALAITPAKAVLSLPHVVVVRRMIGLSAMCYGLAHLVLYLADEKWRLLHVAGEIVLRFYLTIGFLGLAMLVALGWTSRDSSMRRLGPAWKRLQRLSYVVGILGAFHYYLQAKADVAQAVLASGVFVWLMLWRQLPAGRDRGPFALLGLAAAASVLTLAIELAWYRFGTKIDAARVFRGEFDVAFGLKPAGQVLALGVLVAVVAELRRIGTNRHCAALWANVLIYGGGAAVAAVAAIALGWTDPDADELSTHLIPVVWAGLSALMGIARWRLIDRPARHWLDALWVACLFDSIAVAGLDTPSFGMAANGVVILAALALAARLWPVSRASAALVVPVAAWTGYATSTMWGG